MMVVLWTKKRDGGWRWEWYGGYERIVEIRGMTALIGFKTPRIGVITHWIGCCTCHIGNGELTPTLNSLKSQFLTMDSPISSELSSSPKITKLSHPSPSLHAMIMSSHQVQHSPSTAYTEYCIIRRLTFSHSQPVSHLSSLGGPCCPQFSTIWQLWISKWIQSQLPSCLHSDVPPPDRPPPSTPPNSIDYGLDVHL